MRNLAILLCLCGVARADDPLAASRDHYARGRALYLENQNDEALREFEAGYSAAPRVEFLINIGLCHMRLGRPGEARQDFEKFLAAAPENHKQRKNVEELLEKAKNELSRLPAQTPLAPEPEPPAPPPSPVPVVSAPSPAPLVVVAAPPKKTKPWWIIPVVGVVVVGVAVGLGVGLGLPSGCAAQKGLCVDASR